MAIMLKTHRFTVDEYHRMGEAGIFSEDNRVELTYTPCRGASRLRLRCFGSLCSRSMPSSVESK
jgi:hypothetical protein